MKFAYQWLDREGVIHYTYNCKKADEARHDGNLVKLTVLDSKAKDGTDRVAS